MRKAYTQFILVHSYPKSYIQSPETIGYLLCNQNPDYINTTKEVTLNTSSHTITTEIRTPSDSALTQQYSEIQEIQKGLHLMKIKSKDYNNPIPLL